MVKSWGGVGKKEFQVVKEDKNIAVYTWREEMRWKVLEVPEVLRGRIKIVSFLLHLYLLSIFLAVLVGRSFTFLLNISLLKTSVY